MFGQAGKEKLRKVRKAEGRYLLRSNLSASDPAGLWQTYIQLTEIEQAFKEPKSDLSIRPIYHQKEDRIEAHIFVAIYGVLFTGDLEAAHTNTRTRINATAVLEQFAAMQMVDVHLPTTDGRDFILPRYTQPEKELQLLLSQLKLTLPKQPPPRIKQPSP